MAFDEISNEEIRIKQSQNGMFMDEIEGKRTRCEGTGYVYRRPNLNFEGLQSRIDCLYGFEGGRRQSFTGL
jgi:hypothetical protein